MFGYIRPNKLELKLKEIYRYQELYCSLCQAIRTNYGQIYGCALSYDLTFLIALLNGFCDDQEPFPFRCPLNPLKHKSVSVSKSALDYAAFINYFMVYLKVADDVADEHSILSKLIETILSHNRKYRKQYQHYETIAANLKAQMAQFNNLEKSVSDFDELTNSFGDFFAEIFLAFFRDMIGQDISPSLHKLCFNLGKWIYLIDAYDDYPKDREKKRFNLLSTMYFDTPEPEEDQIHKRVQCIVNLLQNNMKRYLNEVQTEQDRAIIENIVLYGCAQQYAKILKNRYPQYATDCNHNCDCCGSR